MIAGGNHTIVKRWLGDSKTGRGVLLANVQNKPLCAMRIRRPLRNIVIGWGREPMDSYHVRSVIGKRLCLFCFGLFWQCILDENRDIVLLYTEKNEVNSMVNILVADDDKNTRLLMKAILEGAGYHVTVAVDGQDALDVLEKEHIDLVVLDVMMPRMDGYAFT